MALSHLDELLVTIEGENVARSPRPRYTRVEDASRVYGGKRGRELDKESMTCAARLMQGRELRFSRYLN